MKTTWQAEKQASREDLEGAVVHALADLDCDLAAGDSYNEAHYRPYAESVLRHLTPLLVSNALQDAATKFEDPEVQRRLRELAFEAETGCDHTVVEPEVGGPHVFEGPCGCPIGQDHWSYGKVIGVTDA